MDDSENIINEFIEQIDSIYGLYLDSVFAYRIFKSKMIEINKDQPPNFIIQVLNDNPDYPETKEIHRITLGGLLTRLDVNGKDTTSIGNACAVMIYQLWEDEYRKRIAICFNKQKNEIKSDLFGELRYVRQGIIHKMGEKTSNFEKIKIISFSEGDRIEFTENQFEELINAIKIELKLFINLK